ncbi:MAG: sigma-70 family RNA polymerase sigma factor [Anaerolineae bacterium]
MEWVEDLEPSLLDRAQKLDETALAHIYDGHYLAIYRYLYRQLGDVDTARDLTADVFQRLLMALHTGKGPKNHLTAWLYRTAHNILVDHYRRQQHRQHLPLAEEMIGDGDGPMEAVERHLLVEQLRRALQQLSPDQQQVIALKFLEDLSNEQVACIMGRSVGAVKALQHRALNTLQRQMGLSEEKASTNERLSPP